jgi:hypothetical protein
VVLVHIYKVVANQVDQANVATNVSEEIKQVIFTSLVLY